MEDGAVGHKCESGPPKDHVSRFYYKNSESDFIFLHQNQNILFSNIGNQNIFLEQNHTPSPPPSPFKLNGRSLKEIVIIVNQMWQFINIYIVIM
jgi:hypothetical protein